MPALEKALNEYLANKWQSFHTPGHKGKLPFPLSQAAPYDLTETDLTGDLFSGGAPFDEAEALFADFYGDGAALLSCGGSTLSIQAMLAAFCGHGRDIIMLRGCHRSAISACALLGLNPRWVSAERGEEARAIAEALKEAPRASAVYLTNPDYFGYIMPIAEIASVCEEYGVYLLVDAAQGAHLKYFDLHPVSLGADAAATSPHKTLPALTGASLLHLKDASLKEKVRAKMALFASTSPSYLILLSLDMLSGRISALRGDFRAIGEKVRAVMELARGKGLAPDISPIDPLRITLDFSGIGISGDKVADNMKNAGISPELIWGGICVLLPSPESDLGAVSEMISSLPDAAAPILRQAKMHIPQKALTIREALLGDSESIPTLSSAGRICACIKTVCPPGIPVIMPGEILEQNTINLLIASGFDTIDVLKFLSDNN